MTLPDAQTLYDVIDATWPAMAKTNCGPVTLRKGAGGGSRVSAATVDGPTTPQDLTAAAQAMIAMQQPALFMIRMHDDAVDRMLAEMGYVIKDPVTLYAAPIAAIAQVDLPPKTAFPVWPPLAVQQDIWAAGGIGQGRLAVMQRADCPKTTILGRVDDHPAGTTYVGLAQGCAMIHALEISAQHRRRGLARQLTIAAARWGLTQGARHLTLVTTQANVGANALYASLGMTVVGQYHYRIKPETAT